MINSVLMYNDYNIILELIVSLLIALTYIINIIYILKNDFKQQFIKLIIPLILFIGSQGMMIISPVMGYRNVIYGYVMLYFIACFLINQIITPAMELKGKYLTIVSLILALVFNIHMTIGYHSTYLTEQKNIAIIKNTPQIINDESATITLYKYPNYKYSLYSLFDENSDFYLNCYKEYYNIKCNVKWK